MNSVRVKFDIDNVCRTCLSATTNLRSLTALICADRTIFDVLSDILDDDIELSEQLPYQICNECEEVLFKCEKLRQTCVRSEEVLKNWLISIDDKSSVVSRDDRDNGTPVQFQCSICRTYYKNIPELEEHFSLVHLVKTDISYDYCSDNNLDSKIKEEGDSSEEGSDENYNEPDDVDYAQEIPQGAQMEVLPQKYEPFEEIDVKLEPPTHTCYYCDVNFESMKELNTHVRKKHEAPKPIKKYQCTLCMRQFSRKSTLELHIKKHEEAAKKCFACSDCKREFRHKAHLINHLKSAHKDKKKVDDEPKEHCCKVCGKGFQMLSTLKDHYRVHTGEKPYLCSTCGRGFSQKTNLKQHIRRHLGLKPFPCSICDLKFVSKGELTAHLRTHSGAHPFICETCNSGFTTSSSLTKHRRIHTGEKRFACDLCPMKFTASSTLKNHRKTHTGEKPYHCAHCDKAFVQRHDLISHTRCHTGEKPYVCAVCGQAFRQASTLRTHVKIHSYKESPAQNKECLNRNLMDNIVCENSGSGSS